MSDPALVTASPLDAEQPDTRGWNSWVSPRAVVAVLTIIGTVLRLLHLGKRSIWHDEAFSIALTHLSWSEMLTASREAAMSPYQVVVRLWMMLFGDSEASVRMPSVIFSVATLPLLYALARRLAGMRGAVAATILFAVNLYSIRYAQEARCYSLMTLLAVCSWVFFLRCLDAPSIPNYATYVMTTVLGAYTHIFDTLSYPAQWIPLAWRSRRIKLRFGLIASIVLICALVFPKGLSVLLTDVGQGSWTPPLRPAAISALFCEFSGSMTTGRGEFLLTAVYLIAVVCGALALIFDDRESDHSGDRRWFILLGFAFPIVVVLVTSLVKPLLVNRYLSEALPFFVILCASGLCRMWPRWIGAAGLVAIVVLSLYQDYLYYRYYKGDDWRAASTYILADAKPGDAVIFVFAGSRWPYDYYLSKSGLAEFPPVIFPAWDRHFSVEGIDWAHYASETTIFEPIVMRAIDNAPKRYDRIWLAQWPIDFFRDADGDPYRRKAAAMNNRLLAAIGTRYRLNSEKDFDQIHLLLYDRTSNAPD
jgi:mannosyltransferase